MIQAQARDKLSQNDITFIVNALCRKGERESTLLNLLADPEMRDEMLDHPQLFQYLLQYRKPTFISPILYFYILLRKALKDNKIDHREVTDYLACLLTEFVQAGRAHRINSHATKEYHYLVDLMQDLIECKSDQTFYIHSHLGNYALFLTGIFPDYISHRVKHHPPSPNFSYYEQVGSSNYQIASQYTAAQQYQLSEIYSILGCQFKRIRLALNHFSDSYLALDKNPGAMDQTLRRVNSFIDRQHQN